MSNNQLFASLPERASGGSVADVFRTPERYYRSVHLASDFRDPRAVSQYVLTPRLRDPFLRIRDGLSSGSTRRAWRITGDYGSGKSSFALVLAHLLEDHNAPALKKIRAGLGIGAAEVVPRLLPVLVTGSRARLVPAVGRAVLEALAAAAGAMKVPTEALVALNKAVNDGTGTDLVRGLGLARDAVADVGLGGILLIVDELGKFLEEAAANPEQSDVFVLQQLAEQAARSGARPIILVGLLHQGFQAYSERLGQESRLEWEKVAGRFEEMTFDQPLSHTTALVRAALNVRVERLSPGTDRVAKHLTLATQRAGWAVAADGEDEAALLDQYPLHPMVLPVLIRFFSRYGQNERSLFNFLLSHDVGTLQEFAERPLAPDAWYTLADFYDYLRAAYGHALGGASYQTHWSRVVDTLDALSGSPRAELRLLKTVAVLNAVDAEHLAATAPVLCAALTVTEEPNQIEPLIDLLCRRGVLFERGRGGDYRLWPSSSVSLGTARAAAEAALGDPQAASQYLASILDRHPLLARRHAIQFGTLRYFAVQYLRPDELRDAPDAGSADGTLVVALCETTAEQARAQYLAKKLSNPRVVVLLPPPLCTLTAEVHEVRIWEWVIANTPELAHDGYSRSEAQRQLGEAKAVLQAAVASRLPLRTTRADTGVRWVHGGKMVKLGRGGLTSLLSTVCDSVFERAPQVHHELLNRQVLSSAGAAARSRLIERMFTQSGQAQLGFEPDRTPPEKSMYLSVLERGRVHRLTNGRLSVAFPVADEGQDPLNLAPVLGAIFTRLHERPDERVPVADLLDLMRAPPFGVRAGLALLLLAILFTAHGHEIAVYEDGTFLARFEASAFLRLSKAPGTFSLQWAAVTGVRAAVFDGLREVFADGEQTVERNLLDVIRPLCIFVAKDIPPFAQRSKSLGASAIQVRESLLHAKDPSTMLFRELPEACGMEPFEPDQGLDQARIVAFVGALRSAVDELRGAYPALLRRLEESVATALGLGTPVNRAAVAAAAAAVAFRAVDDLPLRAFAGRLADLTLTGDRWLESVASTVLAKPARTWLPGDEERFNEQLSKLARQYLRIQIVMGRGELEAATAYHVGLTSITGEARDEVVTLRPDQTAEVAAITSELRRVLGVAGPSQLVAVAHLLWDLLPPVRENQ